MSKNVALFIDVANIYYAARGQDVDVDYIALLKHVTKGRDLIRAYAYSGLDPENENQRKFLDFLSKNGYKVVHKDIRKFGDGRVKANLDIELVVDLFRLQDRMDIAVIVSGDGDFASAIRALQDVGVRCEVISFRPNTSSDLIAVADEFTDIMKIAGIGRAKESKVPPMPEMPAKEVNPEFGFREASRGVAAAALAALREGEQPSRSRRGRGTRAAAPQAVPAVAGAEAVVAGDEPVETMTAAEAHVDGTEQTDGARRRRRRRGGRGRGRSRRGDETLEAGAPAEPSGEIGWQEFDDLSQLGDLSDLGEPGEERDYGFTEADAATLAELGLAVEDDAADAATTAPVSEPATPAAARRRGTRGGRTRTGRAEEPTVSTEANASAGDEPSVPASTPARTRRRRTTVAPAPPEEATQAPVARTADPADATPAAPSRRATRSRRTASTAATPAEAPAGEGSPAATPSRPRRSRRTTGAAGAATDDTATSDAGDQAAPGSTPSDAPTGGTDDQGIWQRFRSGRRTTRRTTTS